MNMEQLHGANLKGLPMRAWLHKTEASASSVAKSQWLVEHRWKSVKDTPLLVDATLRLLKLRGITCCAIKAGARSEEGEGDPSGADERAVVYLLNPADACVWQAIESWIQAGHISVLEGPTTTLVTPVNAGDLQVLLARAAEGEELESDMLAGSILELVEQGRLEEEVARLLDVKGCLYCAVVETPMMCKSMQPVDEKLLRQHKEHEANRALLEGVWS